METGSQAELVYPRFGCTRVSQNLLLFAYHLAVTFELQTDPPQQIGVIEDFGISPNDGRLVAETFFYKDLRKSEVITI
jgi:hypothetical protein